jgi:mycofactocin system FadH/OYE family oxidoreductase 1
VPSLVEPLELAGVRAPSRVVFGPHVTNLGRNRSLSDRHVAYYRTRAAGGAGIVVTETASVHPSDWPYERAPLAADCGPGWREVAAACRPFGTVVLAGLGHRGAQGSSAYSQSALWGPSPVADVINREMPMVMEESEIAAAVEAYRSAAQLAVASGLDGVEVDAGVTSLLRQFHSGLTNLRTDAYGDDRLALTRDVLGAVRSAIGNERVLGLRLSCDELAPWAGVTPVQAADHVAALADAVDMIVVVRGGPFSRSAYRPDAHSPANFNRDLCRSMRVAVAGRALLVLQGSVVDPADAQRAVDDGVADLVEMTRAQIADPRLVARLRSGDAGRVRPCILCNQACQVDDVRNPLVSCVGEPRSGYETEDADTDPIDGTDGSPGEGARLTAVVVGAGVAGLECARVLAARGARVRIVERSDRPGGMCARVAVGPGRERLANLTDWLVAECRRLGVALELGRAATLEMLDGTVDAGGAVVLATGSRPAPTTFAHDGRGPLVDAADLLVSGPDGLADGPVLVWDPVGGPIGVGVAEWLASAGFDVDLVTPDPVAGTLLSRTGDLADANVRLQRAGVRRRVRSRLLEVHDGTATIEDVWTGARTELACASVVDGGHRLPEDDLARRRPGLTRAGDCVAPRTVLEAVLEGRRRALEAMAGAGGVHGDLVELVG